MVNWRNIQENINDFKAFGLSSFLRHLGRFSTDRVGKIHVKGIGAVFVRGGGSDIACVRQVFAEEDYDLSQPPALGKRIIDRYEAILAGGGRPIIVDAGANIGAASLWFSKTFPRAAVVAVEPDPGNAAMLRRNLAGRANCKVLEAAIGSERGHVTLAQNGMEWAVQTERADAGLPVVTVQDSFAASGGTHPFIVKVDIEGFEKDLFASNLDWLNDSYVVFIEPHDWMMPGQSTSRAFQQAMAPHPFEIYLRGENLAYVSVAH